MAISIKFPFQESFEGGVFRFAKTTPEKVRSNLIALLTMKRKNRPMHNNLFSPLWDTVFEPWDEISADRLRTSVLDKITSFIPEIAVQNIVFSFNEDTNTLSTKVIYSIIEMAGATDFVEIDIIIQPPA